MHVIAWNRNTFAMLDPENEIVVAHVEQSRAVDVKPGQSWIQKWYHMPIAKPSKQILSPVLIYIDEWGCNMAVCGSSLTAAKNVLGIYTQVAIENPFGVLD